MNCCICFTPFDHAVKQYQCSDKTCQIMFCEECLNLLINFSKSEMILPKCPGRDCKQILLLCDLPLSLHDVYQTLCFDYFIKNESRHHHLDIIRKIREERKVFIDNTYPVAIAMISSIAFSSKLKEVENKKKKLFKKQQHRHCMNNTCNGILDDKLVCLTCQTVFCQQCEQRLQKDIVHRCKQEDLDAIHVIHNMIKCTGCNLPIFKNEGCDSITCSYCNTNFDYKTGQIGGHGSHNAKILVNLEQRKKLSVIYDKKLSPQSLTMLIDLENKEPKVISKNTLLLPINKYYKTKNDKQCAKSLAKRIENYYLNRLSVRDYQQNMLKLETLIQREDMDERELLKIMS
ncbi:MAG TPA: hypothetical protein VLG50_06545 [Candidatus Saccharimonadales bacterium]|nr:hypothetical protein [Candidatus Saccharimonadales bacterium]